MTVVAKSGAKEVIIEAKIIRANGEVEDLGVVARNSKNPFKNLMWKFKDYFKIK